ncbi:hypothetical protein ASD16_17435 [Cellulomonas sp. Root485]|uniref:hypothetical protein n=1 Tax=Cellulomonas sp. Root485 TaxID=1736546 RepID=UPI0006F627A2|nr:hypothetical protein [Cellulomonas sp. Root485]KQY22384.1 hypothetical protein ASD16_17435 [Cellulomonas sp. Root485]
MSSVSRRVAEAVARDFGAHAPDVVRRLEKLSLHGNPEHERVHAAIVFSSMGDLCELDKAAALAALDWRDVLVHAGLADADWPNRLDAKLGPTNSGIAHSPPTARPRAAGS